MMSLKACIIYIFAVILKCIGRMMVTGINCSNIDLNDKICHYTKILLGRKNFVNDQQRVFALGMCMVLLMLIPLLKGLHD